MPDDIAWISRLAYLITRREQMKVEMLFAHLKRSLKLDRLRLRGTKRSKRRVPSCRHRQNLRKMARLIQIEALALTG